MDKKDITDTLLRIDEEVFLTYGAPDVPYPVVIVGGSAFMLSDMTRRPATHDIDILQADRHVKEVIGNYRMVNSSVAAYMDQIPYNFEDRLVEIDLPTKAIRYMVPSLEDLAVMKLYAWRPSDQEDLTNPLTLQSINWDLLHYLVTSNEEAKASALSPRRYREMLHVYEEYRKEFGR